jgi:hypothetical protein
VTWPDWISFPGAGVQDPRGAVSEYRALVDAAWLEAKDAWSKPRPYKDVLALHVRLGDAAERLCDGLLLYPDHRFTRSREAVRSYRSWVSRATGRSIDDVEVEGRAECVEFAVDLWFATGRLATATSAASATSTSEEGR